MFFIERILETWVDGVRRFAWCVIIAVLVATYSLFTYTFENLSINTNTTDMLSKELPFRQRYIEYGDAFPQLRGLLTIVVEAATADRADVAALKLADRLRRETNTVEKIYDFAGEPFFRRNGFLYKDVEELEELADRLSQAQGLLGSLASDTSIRGLSDVLRLAVEDIRGGNAPIGDLSVVFRQVSEVIEAHVDGKKSELSWRSLISGEEAKPSARRRFLQVRVKADWTGFSPAAPAMQTIRAIAKEEGLTPDKGVRVRLTGGLALSTEELSSVFEGAKSASLLHLSAASGSTVRISRTQAVQPPTTAKSRAVLHSTLLLNPSRRTSTRLPEHLASVLAPCLSSMRTISTSPSEHAAMRGVIPSWPEFSKFSSMSPSLSSSLTFLVSPFRAAFQNRGLSTTGFSPLALEARSSPRSLHPIEWSSCRTA